MFRAWTKLTVVAFVALALPILGFATPEFRVGEWKSTVLFDWSKNRCVEADTPDEPPRIFRDYRGDLHLMATHDDNRELIGRDFIHFRHPCRVAFSGQHSNFPADFSDREWLTSFFTDDGKDIITINHDEFQGNLRPSICPSLNYMFCWENALTYSVSGDGGYSFHEEQRPKNLVASLPYVNQGELGRPIGYFQPSNVLTVGGFNYFMFHSEAFRDQHWGTCIARTSNIRKAAWSFWGGAGYGVLPLNPYIVSPASSPPDHVCEPVGRGSLFDTGSLTYSPSRREFVAVTAIPFNSGNKWTPPGVYISTSVDLIKWSPPCQLASEAQLSTNTDKKASRFGFYSLIDENSDRLDFSTISLHPILFLYFVEFFREGAPFNRKLVKFPVTQSPSLNGQAC